MALPARSRIAARPGDAYRRGSRTAFPAVALRFRTTLEMDDDVGEVARFAPPEPVSQASAGFLHGRCLAVRSPLHGWQTSRRPPSRRAPRGAVVVGLRRDPSRHQDDSDPRPDPAPRPRRIASALESPGRIDPPGRAPHAPASLTRPEERTGDESRGQAIADTGQTVENGARRRKVLHAISRREAHRRRPRPESRASVPSFCPLRRR